MARCVGCRKGLAYKTVDDLCNNCLKARDLYESGAIPPSKPRLKLYRVTLHDPASGIGQPIRARKNALMYVLGKSEPSTVESVQEYVRSKIDDWTDNVQVTSIKELTGPFKHGHVLYYSETDN